MKTKEVSIIMMVCLLLSWGFFPPLSAKQAAWDTVKNNHSGIPNSGNTLQPNSGPEFPHSSFPIQSTDPGPLFHGPSGVMFDTIPNPQKIPH